MFDSEISLNYKNFIRTKALLAFQEGLFDLEALKGLEPSNISTSALSYLLFSQGKLPKSEIELIIKKDIESKSKFIRWSIYDSGLEEISQKEIADIESGLELASNCIPQLSLIQDSLLEHIEIVPREGRFESFSDPQRFTSIFLKNTRKNDIRWGEILSHELSHQYFFAVTSANPVFRSEKLKNMHFSQIRKVQRPLIGVLHGVVAEATMVKYYENLLKSPGLFEAEQISFVESRYQELKSLFEREFYPLKDNIVEINDPYLNLLFDSFY